MSIHDHLPGLPRADWPSVRDWLAAPCGACAGLLAALVALAVLLAILRGRR